MNVDESLAHLFKVAIGHTNESLAVRHFLSWVAGEPYPADAGGLGLRRMAAGTQFAALTFLAAWGASIVPEENLRFVLDKIGRHHDAQSTEAGPGEGEFLERIGRLCGPDELQKWGGWWRRRFRMHRKNWLLIWDQLEAMNAEGELPKDPAAFARYLFDEAEAKP